MRKKGCILIGLLFVSYMVYGQQISQYSQWSFNQFAINPALAGVKKCLDIRTAYRAQWIGIEGAPQSGLFTINAPLFKRAKRYRDFFHGIGGKIERDAFGPFSNFSVGLAYALHIPLGKEQHLSFGVLGGVQQLGFDQTKVTTIDADPAVAQSSNNFLFPLISFGGWYSAQHFFVGAAVDQLAMNKWKNIGFASRFRIHTKIQSGGKFSFENGNSILPVLLVRIPPAGPMSIDFNVMFDIKNTVVLGLGYRNTDALIAFLKVSIGKFSIGYSFDFITSSIRGGNFHTHEISLQFNGCREKARSQSACPLFE